jgi:ribosomal protein L11 methyltransferase
LGPLVFAGVRRKSRTYHAVGLKTAAALADEAAGILIAHGAMGCEVRKMAGASARSGDVYLQAYFKCISPPAARRIAKILAAAGMLAPGAVLSVHSVEDPGWATMWQARFEPFTVGKRLLIVPPWTRARAPGRIQLVIKPGQAFGTGHHASTCGTLAMIEQFLDSGGIARALDVGTGSGILALAMAKLGVPDVTAIDIDATALENARENAALNGLDGAIRFSAAPLGSIRGRFDLIAANILSSVVIAMAPQLTVRLRPHARLILAGILSREADAVFAAYRPAVKLIGSRHDGKWIALTFRR